MHVADAPVVVGTDGGAAALAAVRLAAVEAAARGVPLRVVHAFAWSPYDPGRPYQELRDDAAALLDRAVLAAGRAAPSGRAEGLLVDGSPVRVLLMQSRSAGLLVLGDDAEMPAFAVPLDSVLLQVVARSWCPVLIAREGGAPGGPVVAAVDASPPSADVLRHAAADAGHAGAALTVLHVAPQGADAGEAARAVTAVLGDTADGYAHTLTVATGDPGAELIRAARAARRLVVGARGADAWPGTLLGEVAQTVVRHAPCQVVVVHGRRST